MSDLQLREKSSPKKLGFPELRSEKSDLIPQPQILGPFGPHEKRVTFDTFRKQQMLILCFDPPNHLTKYTIVALLMCFIQQ